MSENVETVQAVATIEPTPSEPAPAPDLSAELAALRSQLAELRAAKEASDAAAESAKVAAMSEAEKLEADRVAWRAEVDQERARLRTEARTAALQKAGVLPTYHDFVPDLDPRTADGAKQLEAWIAKHPETVKVQAAPEPSRLEQIGKQSSAVAQILTGQRRSTLVTAKSLAAMFDKR